MKKILMICTVMFALADNISAQNKYEIRCWIVGDSLNVNVDYVSEKEFPEVEDYVLLTRVANIMTVSNGGIGCTFHNDGDTIRFDNLQSFSNPHLPKYINLYYTIPLSSFRTADGAIVLRREGNWYPHINGELLTAQVHIKADDYYILGGTEWLPSFDIHLVLLPKDKYACKVIDTPTRPFHFYRLASDTTQYPDAYYREFVDSYNFYCTFFGDSLSSKPMNIVEIGDPQFIMCQSLRDMIIFGHYFYDVYTMIPDFSWIPHEVAHQWWGNGIFFEYRDYALSESLNEYIKLQFLKSRGRGYEEQIAYYKTMMERAEKKLPISDIHSVESQDESIAIYHAAPYRLSLMDMATVNTALRQLYNKHKYTTVGRDTFLQECQSLRLWLSCAKQLYGNNPSCGQ